MKIKEPVAGQKRQKLFHAKSVNAEEKSVTGYISTYGWDRAGERMAKGSWRLDSYRRNPVVLWAHDGRSLPIARCVELKEDDFGLLAKCVFDDQSDYAMEVFSLYERGFLNAFSVGFIPVKWEMEDRGEGDGRKGIVWTDNELLEYSAVSVPANAEALVSGKDAEFVIKEFGASSLQFVEELADGTKVWKMAAVEKNADEEHVAEVQEEGLENAVKTLTKMAKLAAHEGLDSQKAALIRASISVLGEILSEHGEEEISQEDIDTLNKCVAGLAEVIKNRDAAMREDVSRFLMKFEAAMKQRRHGAA